jgi:hypothetical protein
MATLCIQQSAIVPDVSVSHNRPPGRAPAPAPASCGHALRIETESHATLPALPGIPLHARNAAAKYICLQSKFHSYIVFILKKQ